MFGEEQGIETGRHRGEEIDQDRPHRATEHDAGTGQGTVHDPHYESHTLEHPVLDGANESATSQAKTGNPYRGLADPALVHGIRHHAQLVDEEVHTAKKAGAETPSDAETAEKAEIAENAERAEKPENAATGDEAVQASE